MNDRLLDFLKVRFPFPRDFFAQFAISSLMFHAESRLILSEITSEQRSAAKIKCFWTKYKLYGKILIYQILF